MKLRSGSLVVVAALVLGAAGALLVAPKAAKSTAARTAQAGKAPPRAVEGYAKLPLSFEANQGQTDAQVKFLARGQGYTLFLTSQEAVLSLQKSERWGRQDRELEEAGSELVADRYALFNDRSSMATERPKWPDAPRLANTSLQMKLVGANPKARVKGADELPGKSNYFMGNDPKKWRTNVPTYAKVRVESIYPGVDLVYYGNQGQLEYDFVVRPGADPNVIRLALGSSRIGEGAAGSNRGVLTHIDGNGDLLVGVEGGEVRFHRPVIYQPATTDKMQGPTEKTLIAGGYTVNERNEVAFAIGDYDRTKPVVIDPVLSYSTYLGGSGPDFGQAIAADSSGNAYVTGSTESTDFPTTANAFQHVNHGAGSGGNAFIAKLSADGSALIYSTYLGGSGSSWGGDAGLGIAINASGNAYVVGVTQSGDFPTVNALQRSKHGTTISTNAFVTELTSDGSGLVYSTYLGGSACNYNDNGDTGSGIAVDGSGSAYVVGRTCSLDFPIANAFQAVNNVPPVYGATTAFVTKFSSDGSALVYSTYLGGTRHDVGTGIAVDSSGNAYVTGYTYSTDFPVTPNAFQGTNHVTGSGSTVFVTKFNAAGSALVYSTYLGGTRGDSGAGIAIDSSGHAYVTGQSDSVDFPTTPNAFQATNHSAASGGTADAFVTELSTDGSALVYSTYLGGSFSDSGYGIAVNDSGNAFVVGSTLSTDFPTANPIQASNHGGRPGQCSNVFVTEFNADGSALVYSTYLGGSNGFDVGQGIAVDSSGVAYVTGWTSSTDFPTTSNAFQTAAPGAANGFVAKISNVADLTITNTGPRVAPSGSTLTYAIMVTNNGPATAINVSITDVLPTGTTFNSVAISGGTCTAPAPGSSGTVTCTVPTLGLNSGDTIVETLVVNLIAAGGAVVTDTAMVSSWSFDPTAADNSATATTSVI